MTSEETVKALGAAAAGLLYPSETDAPLTPFSWPSVSTIDAAAVEAATRPKGSRKKRPVVEQTVDEFFAELEDTDDAVGFKKLKTVVEKALTGAKVFRVGKTKVDVYLVGLAADGGAVGLHTVSVET